MYKKYKLKDTLARLFGARKAKSLIKGLKEDVIIYDENVIQELKYQFTWDYTKQGHKYWRKVDSYAARKIKGYEPIIRPR